MKKTTNHRALKVSTKGSFNCAMCKRETFVQVNRSAFCASCYCGMDYERDVRSGATKNLARDVEKMIESYQESITRGGDAEIMSKRIDGLRNLFTAEFVDVLVRYQTA